MSATETEQPWDVCPHRTLWVRGLCESALTPTSLPSSSRWVISERPTQQGFGCPARRPAVRSGHRLRGCRLALLPYGSTSDCL